MPNIEPGQVYRHCDPRESIRVRIESYRPGDARAHVVDAVTGKRHRQILVKDLHDSPVTNSGRRRRSGYVLEHDSVPTPAIPAEAVEGSPLERAEQAVRQAEQSIGAAVDSGCGLALAIRNFEEAVRSHDAAILRAEAAGHDCVEWEDAANRLDPDKAADTPPAIIRYDDALAVRLHDWEFNWAIGNGVRTVELEGTLAAGSPLPRVGGAVKVVEIGIPGRGALADLYATITLDSDEDVRLKLTTTVEAGQ